MEDWGEGVRELQTKTLIDKQSGAHGIVKSREDLNDKE